MMSFGSRLGVSMARKTTGPSRMTRQSMNNTALEEEQVARSELGAVRDVSHPECASAGQNIEVLVGAGMVMRRRFAVDPKYPGACRLFIREISVQQQSLRGIRKRLGDFIYTEPLEALFLCHWVLHRQL